MKRKSTKARDALSRKRQALWLKLKTMRQRELDMCVAADLGIANAFEKLTFARLEAEKLEKEIKRLELGVSRQRAWARGTKI
jgi:hypothetical protein